MTAEPGDLDRLKRMLGSADTAWLLRRMRDRLERTGALVGTVSKSAASTAERTAAARLLGRPVRAGQSVSVPLEALDAMLRRSGAWPHGLASAVVTLAGEVTDPAARLAERDGWRVANERLRALAADRPQLSSWVTGVFRGGSLKRASGDTTEARALAEQLAAIATALPAAGESLAAFSARVAGHAHALDAQTSLGSLAVGMASHLAPVTSNAAPGSARWRRDAWQSVGVVVDELSSTVLVHSLPGGTTSPTARALAALAEAGQPAILTLRQLMTDAVGSVPGIVHVCENPAVITAAADRLGAGCAPMVCLNGQPGAAAVRLLKALAAHGAMLRYHGDFDWGGMAIARTLARHVGWEPWRFCAADYEQACASLADLPALVGTPADTPWDRDLAAAMATTGRKVEEELVLDALVGDLAAAATG